MRKILGKKAFTLIEVTIVLVMLGIIIAIAVPSVTGFIDITQKRNCKAVRENIAADIVSVIPSGRISKDAYKESGINESIVSAINKYTAGIAENIGNTIKLKDVCDVGEVVVSWSLTNSGTSGEYTSKIINLSCNCSCHSDVDCTVQSTANFIVKEDAPPPTAPEIPEDPPEDPIVPPAVPEAPPKAEDNYNTHEEGNQGHNSGKKITGSKTIDELIKRIEDKPAGGFVDENGDRIVDKDGNEITSVEEMWDKGLGTNSSVVENDRVSSDSPELTYASAVNNFLRNIGLTNVKAWYITTDIFEETEKNVAYFSIEDTISADNKGKWVYVYRFIYGEGYSISNPEVVDWGRGIVWRSEQSNDIYIIRDYQPLQALYPDNKKNNN